VVDAESDGECSFAWEEVRQRITQESDSACSENQSRIQLENDDSCIVQLHERQRRRGPDALDGEGNLQGDVEEEYSRQRTTNTWGIGHGGTGERELKEFPQLRAWQEHMYSR